MRAKRIAAPKSSGHGKSINIQAAENIGAMVARGTRTTGKLISKGKKVVDKKEASKKTVPAKPEKPKKPQKPEKAPRAPKPEKPNKEKPRASTPRKDGLPPAVNLSFDK